METILYVIGFIAYTVTIFMIGFGFSMKGYRKGWGRIADEKENQKKTRKDSLKETEVRY